MNLRPLAPQASALPGCATLRLLAVVPFNLGGVNRLQHGVSSSVSNSSLLSGASELPAIADARGRQDNQRPGPFTDLAR